MKEALPMQSAAISTIIKMLESLPEPAQNQVVEYLRNYIAELQDEARWDELVARTQPKLIEAAQRARLQIAEGLATPLDEGYL
jgi:hypothetical protein